MKARGLRKNKVRRKRGAETRWNPDRLAAVEHRVAAMRERGGWVSRRERLQMRRATAAFVRWAALLGLYLAFAGQGSAAEIVAGLLAGLAAAAFSLLLRETTEHPFHLRAPWLGLAARLGTSILRDVGRVAAALAEAVLAGHRGARLDQPITPVGSGRAEAGHRALVILLASVAPNAYVLEARRSVLVLHRFAQTAPAADERWPI